MSHPAIYFNRCGYCGAYEGTVDPNEPCPIDPHTGEPLGPHHFGVYERVEIPGGPMAHEKPSAEDFPYGLPF